MSAPTVETRKAVYQRDQYRCVTCNRSSDLTFQHRRAVGMGGSKNRPSCVDGLTLCLVCNSKCEAEMQTLALLYGWKVRRWADPQRVPVFYPHEHRWFRFDGTQRVEISAVVALDMMHAVYGDEYFRWRNG